MRVWRLSAALCSALACLAAAPAVAGAVTYQTQVTNGASIQDGMTDWGLSCDDCATFVSTPFNVEFYGSSWSGFWVSSNGNIQFGSSSTAYSNSSLPTSVFAG